MKIKVCGLRALADVEALSRLPIDYVGFIFYERSARYVGEEEAGLLVCLPSSIKKVGVFVDASLEEVRARIRRYGLDAVQLHGNESPRFCSALKSEGVEVVKAFNVSEASDLFPAARYGSAVDFFLFDAKTPLYGGSGKSFDWTALDDYTGATPFFLSGGISVEDARRVLQLKHPSLHAVDLNSRFETAPGKKNIPLLQQFIHQIKQREHE